MTNAAAPGPETHNQSTGAGALSPRRWRLRDRLAACLLACLVLGLALVLSLPVPRISTVVGTHTDFIMPLVALRAFAQGHDPYSAATALQINSAVAGYPLRQLPPTGYDHYPFHYPLAPTLVYLPLILLPVEAAVMVARVLTVLAYLVALGLLTWRFARHLPLVVQTGIFCLGIAWWPFVRVILPIVQQAGLVFALLVFAGLAAEARRWSWVGVCAYLALIKPVDSLPMVSLLCLWAFAQPQVRMRWDFVRGVALVAVPTLTLAQLLQPRWMWEWVDGMVRWKGNQDPVMVNPPAALARLLHLSPPLAWSWAAVALGALVWLVISWRASYVAAKGADMRVLWWQYALAALLTLVALPRTASYDLVIGLLAWAVALWLAGELDTGWMRAAAYGALTALWVMVVLVPDSTQWALPVFALGLIGLLAVMWPQTQERAQMSTTPAHPVVVG